MQTLSLDAAKERVGEDLGVSDWKLIDQALVNGFADLTGDWQFIHVDPQAAAQTPFGGTIAHGFLTLSLLATLLPPKAIELDGMLMSINYGFDRVRFIQPVRVGKRVRARHRLAALDEKGAGRVLLTTQVVMEVEGEERPAISADWLGMQTF